MWGQGCSRLTGDCTVVEIAAVLANSRTQKKTRLLRSNVNITLTRYYCKSINTVNMLLIAASSWGVISSLRLVFQGPVISANLSIISFEIHFPATNFRGSLSSGLFVQNHLQQVSWGNMNDQQLKKKRCTSTNPKKKLKDTKILQTGERTCRGALLKFLDLSENKPTRQILLVFSCFLVISCLILHSVFRGAFKK